MTAVGSLRQGRCHGRVATSALEVRRKAGWRPMAIGGPPIDRLRQEDDANTTLIRS